MTSKEKAIERIKDRYFRKVIAYPEGAIVHFGDCWWYACQICNCGLHSDLMWLGDGQEELYPKFWKEMGVSDLRREQLHDLPVPEIKPLTKEEEEYWSKELDKMFSTKIYDRDEEKGKAENEPGP